MNVGPHHLVTSPGEQVKGGCVTGLNFDEIFKIGNHNQRRTVHLSAFTNHFKDKITPGSAIRPDISAQHLFPVFAKQVLPVPPIP